ncbi:hypothetical protein NIES593_11735 [Hydrococcus rivularis NIES-593]|uniref:L,D-TPase catalytic domain-containing protein n=1 Tax=Hydrococcus rivularis NIES-593 TaxID=1921803 RepID=A0A1U7HGT5_9CYAN|nr:L,D-transpeptidase [Hydrococcus rivularis]OKH22787.1 hypothetical protein NIES593_11735 [Hydrococcus rivularis NIES-593]
MLFEFVLASFSCVTFSACNSQANLLKTPQVTEVESTNFLEIPTENLTPKKLNSKKSTFASTSDSSFEKGDESKNSIALSSQGSYMTLTPTGLTNTLGNPLYELRLYANGQLRGTYTTVSGRAYTQNRNRHQAGTEAPLPDGIYKVAKTSVAGTIAEAGDRFLAIQPLFRTGRSALGIHYDPSFEKNNGEDGTSGCIALTNRRDLDLVLNYVRTYQPQYLEVNIQ